MNKVKFIVISILFIVVLSILLSAFYHYIYTNYASYNGEYIKSSTSSHQYFITDILKEENVQIINVIEIDNLIYILYFNDQQNSLKLAVSKTLSPASPKDWQKSIIEKSFVKTENNNSELYPYTAYLYAKYTISSDDIDFQMIDNKPCIAYIMKDQLKPEINTLNLLIAKNPKPLKSIDWEHYTTKIIKKDRTTNLSLGYINKYFYITLNQPISESNIGTDLYDLILFSFNITERKWTQKILLKNNNNTPMIYKASIINHPKILYILYFKRKANDKKALGSINLLSIPDPQIDNKSNWIDKQIVIGKYRDRNLDTSEQAVFNSSNNCLYVFLEERLQCFNLVYMNLINGKPENIKEVYIQGTSMKYFKNNLSGPLGILSRDAKNISLVNHKAVATLLRFGYVYRYDIDTDTVNPTPDSNEINFFTKLFLKPQTIYPIPLNNGLSYVFYQANQGKIRLAREVEPSEVPKRDFFSLFGLK